MPRKPVQITCEPIEGTWQSAASFVTSPVRLAERFGIRWQTAGESEASESAAMFAGPGDSRYLLVCQSSELNEETAVEIRIQAFFDDKLADFDIAASELTVLRPGLALPVWRIVRQDDHGNRFVPYEGRGFAAALRQFAIYESYAHKQTFFL